MAHSLTQVHITENYLTHFKKMCFSSWLSEIMTNLSQNTCQTWQYPHLAVWHWALADSQFLNLQNENNIHLKGFWRLWNHITICELPTAVWGTKLLLKNAASIFPSQVHTKWTITPEPGFWVSELNWKAKGVVSVAFQISPSKLRVLTALQSNTKRWSHDPWRFLTQLFKLHVVSWNIRFRILGKVFPPDNPFFNITYISVAVGNSSQARCRDLTSKSPVGHTLKNPSAGWQAPMMHSECM